MGGTAVLVTDCTGAGLSSLPTDRVGGLGLVLLAQDVEEFSGVDRAKPQLLSRLADGPARVPKEVPRRARIRTPLRRRRGSGHPDPALRGDGDGQACPCRVGRQARA
jgi:hypothetical protein